MMEENNNELKSSENVEGQLEKNEETIQKLRCELGLLDKKICEDEKRLEEAKVLISEYEELSERIIKLNQKMKASKSVPQNIKEHFNGLVYRAELIEKDLSNMEIHSMEDCNKLIKDIEDNRQLFLRYNEKIGEIQKQNECYSNIYIKGIQKKEIVPERRDFKYLLIQLKREFDTQISNFQHLNEEISNTERSIKNLLVKKSIANEIYDTLRVVETHLYRYENAREKIRKLNEDMLDINSNLKDSSQKEFYTRQKSNLDKQMKIDYEVMYTNNIISINDFDEKDTYNKEDKKKIEKELEFLNSKLILLKEIEQETKKILKNN